MNDTLKKVDQEGRTASACRPRGKRTLVQQLERLETELRLWRKRRERQFRAQAPERSAPRQEEKRSAAQGKGQGTGTTASRQASRSAGKAAASRESGRSFWETATYRVGRVKRRWRHIRREQQAHRFPESNRKPIQLLLMLGGVVPMLGSRLRERLMGRRRQAVRRSGGIGAWLEKKKGRTVAVLCGAVCVAGLALFFSFYTIGTTVTYDGEVVAKVSSERAARNACKNLEKITSMALGGSYTISDSLLHYSSELMSRQEVVDGETFEEELSRDIGLVTYGYSLYVDGEMIGATPYEGALDELLKQMKEAVTSENTIYCDFQEDVEVKAGYVTTDKIMNLGYLAETLFSTKTEEVTYTVKGGDTWSEIAEDHGMTSAQLLDMNPGYNINRISIGEVLTLSAAVPYLTLMVTEQERYVADVPYEVEYTDSSNLWKGDEDVISAGKYGSADVVANVTYINGEETERTILSYVTLVNPVTEQRLRGTKERPTWYPTGTFRWPCSGSITSRFGGRSSPGGIGSTNHKGIDIANRKGTPIVAADGGTVIYAGWMSGYGYLVQIDHGRGYVTYYGHNSSLLVSVGDHVYKGQQIARMGSTGNSTGNHCHFEVRINGVAKNPLNYL